MNSHATGQGRNNSDRKNKAEKMGLRDRSKGRRHTQGQTRALGGGVCPALFENFTFKNDFATFTYLMYQCLLCASMCMHVSMHLQHRCSRQMTTCKRCFILPSCWGWGPNSDHPTWQSSSCWSISLTPILLLNALILQGQTQKYLCVPCKPDL